MDLDRIPDIAKYLSLIFFLGWFGRHTVWNFLPVFFEQNISSVFLIGILTSIPALIPILTDISVGNLVQRAGSKIVIFLGLVASIFPGILYYTAAPVFLALGKVFEGFTKSLVWNGSWSIVLREPEEDVESESISVFLLGANLAAILGPIIGGLIISAYGFNYVFWIWVFTAVLSILVFNNYIGTKVKNSLTDSVEDLFHKETYTNDFRHLRENWVNLRFPLALIFFYSIIFSFYWLTIPLLLDEVGADFVTMGIIFGLSALPSAFQYMFGDLADRYGRVYIMRILAFLHIPVLFVMTFIDDVLLLGALFLLARLLTGGMSPAIHGIFDEKAPDDIQGELTGFLELCKHSGQALGPILAGAIASVAGLSYSFIMASLIALIIIFLPRLR